MRASFVAALVIVVLAAIFALQNAQPTRVALFFWQFEGPLVLVLLVTFAAGILAGWLAALPTLWKQSRQAVDPGRDGQSGGPDRGRQHREP